MTEPGVPPSPTFTWVATEALPPATFRAILDLCNEAYEEELAPYFRDIGPGEHLLAHVDGRLVGHGIVVRRTLWEHDRRPLPTAYVEVVATRVGEQGKGYGTALLREIAHRIRTARDEDGRPAFLLGALGPAVPSFYERLGWRWWRGPQAVRVEGRLEPSPEDDRIMVLLTEATPPDLDLDALLTVDWRPGEVW